ncbi:hypothetical protein BGZ49_008385, partial [Haplosporangium sp. Z 27]
KVADDGYPGGQAKLGDMYAKGRGVTMNYYKAVELSRKAADKRDSSGQTRLGNMYAKGHGVTRDH